MASRPANKAPFGIATCNKFGAPYNLLMLYRRHYQFIINLMVLFLEIFIFDHFENTMFVWFGTKMK